MRVLLVHNFYQQPGGEDAVFRSEWNLLEEHGNQVFPYTAHNDQVNSMPSVDVGTGMFWNRDSYREVLQLIRSARPDILHAHNTFPLISPSVFYAARREGVPVVQTLHNYRLTCVGSELFRDGHICEDCVGKSPWRGTLHACYRDSHVASSAVGMMLTAHRAMGTWEKVISRYIALTEFARGKFIEAGLPAERIAVKPNFMEPDPGMGDGAGRFALFVGRLTQTKGVETLLSAWTHLDGVMPLKIVGDGPLAGRVQEQAERTDHIHWLGHRSRDEVLQLMRDAHVLVFPSTWYEGFPVVIAEAFASGLPVLASGVGSVSTIVEDGRTGFHFETGDPVDLANKIRMTTSNREEWKKLRTSVREEYVRKYSPETNYKLLMQIYADAQRTALIN